jgi:hypothetical protein
MGKLTDRDLAPNLDLNSLMHVVKFSSPTEETSPVSYKSPLSLFTPFINNDSLIEDTGILIRFDKRRVYNTIILPATGNIITDTSNAKLGRIQKIYHNSSNQPTFFNGSTPWVLIGDTPYFTNVLNIIYAEWCGGDRVEYWINQLN